MNIKMGDFVFDHGHYDTEGDVLYLSRADTNHASDAVLTPEGHGVRYDDDGEVIGVTIINAKWLLDRDGHLTITLPHLVRIGADELATALS